jgi:hypothetical protein
MTRIGGYDGGIQPVSPPDDDEAQVNPEDDEE